MFQVTWDHIHLRSPDPEATATWLRDILGGVDEAIKNAPIDPQRIGVLGITRSVQKRLEEVQPLLDDIEKVEDSDSVVSTLASAIDAMLAPLDDAPSANECLNTAWRDDRLSLTQLGSLLEQVQETSVSRPT